MAAVKGDSRDNLLDAAEYLFAQKGFHGTSTRDIAARSGDTLGTLSHHFKSKDNLMREVLTRRFAALDALRQDHYRQMTEEAGGTAPDLAATVAAIALPFIDRAIRGDEKWRSYTSLAGMVVRSTDVDHRDFYAAMRARYTDQYKQWLKAAAPDADDAQIGYAYDLIITATIGACSDVEFNRRRAGGATGEGQRDYDYVAPRTLRFIIAGVKALVGR